MQISPPVQGSFTPVVLGKEIGILKNAIKNAILDGTIKNEKEEALVFIISKAKELNLTPVQ